MYDTSFRLRAALTIVALLCAALSPLGALQDGPADSVVRRLLAARGEDYVALRTELFERPAAAREALDRALDSGELSPFAEAQARLVRNALADDSSWRRVQGVLRELRDADPRGELAGRSAPGVAHGVREIGGAALAGGSEILLARAARPDELAGLLHALPRLRGEEASALCTALRSYFAAELPPPAGPADRSTPDLLANALVGLQLAGTGCDDAVTDLAALVERTDDPDLAYQAVEVLGWVGHRPQDLLTVIGLAEHAADDCLRRLLASSGHRIFDRMQGQELDSSQPGTR